MSKMIEDIENESNRFKTKIFYLYIEYILLGHRGFLEWNSFEEKK
jgi:hypothetical protein